MNAERQATKARRTEGARVHTLIDPPPPAVTPFERPNNPGERCANHPEASSGFNGEYVEDTKDAEQCRTDVGRRL